jgi:hypothetical protein
MASEAELQNLLRLLMKRKMSMMAALGQAKALREAGLARYDYLPAQRENSAEGHVASRR